METDSITPRSEHKEDTEQTPRPEHKEDTEQTPQSPSVITDAGLCDLWRCIKQLIRHERKLKKYEQIRNRRCNS